MSEKEKGETGREQRRDSDKGKAHAPNLHRWYRYRLPSIHPGEFAFELDILRPRRDGGLHKPFRINKLVDSLQWDDEQNVMTGTVTIHRPDPDEPSSLPVETGQLLRCRLRWDGRKYDLWTMRMEAPKIQIDTATVTLTLKDDMARLKEGSEDWIFRKTKARPHGYTADEITRLVCKRLGLKVGKIARAKKQLSIVKRNASAYDVLFDAWQQEHKDSKHDYIMRIRNGKFEVVKVQRNATLYVLGRELQTALLTPKSSDKTPTTVLTGRGQLGKGKDAQKIKYTHVERRVIRKLGYLHNTKDYGTVSSHKELRDKVKRDLATMWKPDNKLSVTVALIPWVRRADGVMIDLKKEGFRKKQAFVYCQRANHTIQAASATSSFDFVQRDYYKSLWSKEDKALRARADKRRRRRRHVADAGKKVAYAP